MSSNTETTPPTIAPSAKAKLAEDYRVITELMVQLDSKTKRFKEQIEKSLDNSSEIARLTSLFDAQAKDLNDGTNDAVDETQ
jgi:hypothetical protein